MAHEGSFEAEIVLGVPSWNPQKRQLWNYEIIDSTKLCPTAGASSAIARKKKPRRSGASPRGTHAPGSLGALKADSRDRARKALQHLARTPKTSPRDGCIYKV